MQKKKDLPVEVVNLRVLHSLHLIVCHDCEYMNIVQVLGGGGEGWEEFGLSKRMLVKSRGRVQPLFSIQGRYCPTTIGAVKRTKID